MHSKIIGRYFNVFFFQIQLKKGNLKSDFWVPEFGHPNRLVNETCAIVLVQAGTQANQFASAIDCTGKITNFTENHAGKSVFFSEDSIKTYPLIFVSVIRKVKS